MGVIIYLVAMNIAIPTNCQVCPMPLLSWIYLPRAVFSLWPEGLDIICLCKDNLSCSLVAGDSAPCSFSPDTFPGLSIHDLFPRFAVGCTPHVSFPYIRVSVTH